MFSGQNTLSLVDCINEVLSRSSLIAAVFFFWLSPRLQSGGSSLGAIMVGELG